MLVDVGDDHVHAVKEQKFVLFGIRGVLWLVEHEASIPVGLAVLNLNVENYILSSTDLSLACEFLRDIFVERCACKALEMEGALLVVKLLGGPLISQAILHEQIGLLAELKHQISKLCQVFD